MAIEWTLPRPRPQHAEVAAPEEQAAFKKNLAEAVAEEAERNPGATVEGECPIFCIRVGRSIAGVALGL